jgi:hypothetical protein
MHESFSTNHLFCAGSGGWHTGVALRRSGSGEGGGAVVTFCGVLVAFRSIFILFNVGDVKLV